MPRPQFSLKTLLWLMVVVGAFGAGVAFEYGWREYVTLWYYLKYDIMVLLGFVCCAVAAWALFAKPSHRHRRHRQ